MIDALIQGKLHAKAQQRTGKAGRPFVTAKVTTMAKDGNAQFVNVIAFAPDACNALLALGARRPGIFHPGQGTELISFLAETVEITTRAWLDLED